jgi:DNA replication protein DnaC
MGIPKEIQVLANQSFSTEVDPYILTPEEESAAIFNAIEQKKKHFSWKHACMGAKMEQILAKMSGIDWNLEINHEEVLQQANSNKTQAAFHLEQRRKEKEFEIKQAAELKEYWTANRFYSLIKSNCLNEGKEFKIIPEQKELLRKICFFLSEDNRCQDEGIVLNKGLLLRGTSGLGKTDLVKWASGNEIKPIKIISTLDITDQLKANGEADLSNLGDFKILYIDDVGTEEETVNYFGTKILFFKNFIESYYLKNKNFHRLIVSTNLSMQQIEEKYGFRVRSRMNEMFNKVDVSGTDLRK